VSKHYIDVSSQNITPNWKTNLIDRILSCPWKARNEILRWAVYPRVRLLFAFYGIRWRSNWNFYGTPIVQKHRNSIMEFGDGLQLRSSRRSNPLGPSRPCILCTWQAGAHLKVGTDLAATGATLCAAERISIGNNVVIGTNSVVVDTDFHPLDPMERKDRPQNAKTAPVLIEDDVFIGMNCLILKGVTLGKGCVIGAGSVVARSIPPMSIAAGNPARAIRTISESLSAKHGLLLEDLGSYTILRS